MKFVFCDKSDSEKELLTDLLHSEGIKYIVKREYIEFPIDSEDEDEEECIEFFPNYHIEVFTTLEMFEFLKVLFKKKIEQQQMLEKCFHLKMKKPRKKVVKK